MKRQSRTGALIADAVDTNVLLRFILADDPEQHLRARALLDYLRAGRGIVVPLVVLVELDWTLTRPYKVPRAQRLAWLRHFVEAPDVKVSQPRVATTALDAAERTGAGFADCVIVELARDEGSPRVWTFDKAMVKKLGAGVPAPMLVPSRTA